MKEAILLGAYIDTVEKEITLVKTILEWKKHNVPIILSTHYPVNERIQNLVDYYIFDKEQYMDKRLTVKRIYGCPSFDIMIEENKPYHAAAALIAYQHALKLICNKFDVIYQTDYDVELNIPEVLNFIRAQYSSSFELFMFNWKGDSSAYATNVCFFKQGAFNKIWGNTNTVQDYLDIVNLTHEDNMFMERVTMNLIHLKNLHNLIYTFNESQTKLLIKNFSEHTADVKEPIIRLSTTSLNNAILFLINPTPETLLFHIQTKDIISNQEKEEKEIMQGNLASMIWKTYANTFLKVLCSNIKKEYYITHHSIFDECKFEFKDNTQIFMHAKVKERWWY